MAPTPSITTIQQIGIGIAHAYSSLILNAHKNFKVSNNTPGFDIFNFLLPRDQVTKIRAWQRPSPGDMGNRTPDLLHAKQALCQLSYIPL